MKSVVSMVRGSVFAGVLGAMVTLSSAASARDSSDPVDCTSDGFGGVTCTISGGGGGASTFLGAFASDNGGAGGWVEFYSDNDGEWWVEHHQDGTTSVGWETNNIVGPKLGTGNQPGTYSQKSRPALSGALKKVPLRTFAQAKLAASKQTGTINNVQSSGAVTTGFAGVKFGHVSLQGSGQCKAQVIVSKDGKILTSSAPMTMSFPSERPVALGVNPGVYQVMVKGWDGCVGQSKSLMVTVPAAAPAPQRIIIAPERR